MEVNELFRTIRQVSKDYELPENLLRSRLCQKRLPGFYSGNRFMVDVDLLQELLKAESIASIADEAQTKMA